MDADGEIKKELRWYVEVVIKIYALKSIKLILEQYGVRGAPALHSQKSTFNL